MKRIITGLIIAVMLILSAGSFSVPESEVDMPYIPQVKVGNTIYNVKDYESREQINNLIALNNELLYDVADFVGLNDRSVSGITFTVDKQNRTITANGTASGNALYSIRYENITGISNIVLKGGAAGGSGTTYNLALFDASNNGARVLYVSDDEEVKTAELDPSHTYSLRLAIFNGVTVNNAIFTPRAYADGKVLNLEEKVEKIDSIQSRYEHVSGVAFICECGDSIFIDSKNFRLYDKKNNTYSVLHKVDTEVLQGGSSSIRYICFDGSHFSVSPYFSDAAIAYVGDKIVTPLVSGIISNYRAIQNGFLRSDSEYTINYSRTPINAYGSYDGETDVKVSKQAYTYKSIGMKRYRVGKEPVGFSLAENTVNINNRKILMIGDSFVYRGYIQHWLHEFNETLTFLGTKTTGNYNFKSEGVSGSRLYYFTDPDTSPFYFNGNLDFGAYLETNGVAPPDYVIINSAINHSTYRNDEHGGNYLNNLTDIVNMIRTYDSSIKIYVTYGANYAMEPGSTYGYPSSRYEEVRKCCNSVYDVEGIIVIPVDYCLIDELDYQYTTYDYYGDDIQILSDCVHPKEDSGFKKIAYMIYNYLGQ